jgi:hypothetical protein
VDVNSVVYSESHTLNPIDIGIDTSAAEVRKNWPVLKKFDSKSELATFAVERKK